MDLLKTLTEELVAQRPAEYRQRSKEKRETRVRIERELAEKRAKGKSNFWDDLGEFVRAMGDRYG